MSEQECGYLTFSGVTQVLKAEKILAGLGERFSIVPVPREISADCGMCIMCAPEHAGRIREALARAGVACDGVSILKKKGGFWPRLF
jgi:hypothetical protein